MVDRAFAENRFGLGVRAGEAAERGDPQGWVEAQAAKPAVRLAGLPTRADVAGDIAEVYAMRREMKAMKAGGETMSDAMPADAETAAKRSVQKQARDAYVKLVGARVDSAIATDTPFTERMTHFWANHFAVSATKVTTVGFSGLMEMEAIRPHVNGRFRDMLHAVERHPAMLLYLDQAQSIGPNSQLGTRAAMRGNKRGLNENLAREIMELHTLGVRTGYSQADVTEFARALTGWTVGGLARGPAARMIGGGPGDFAFVEPLHEPGARTILGRKFAEDGEAQASAVLDMLATHPATAHHVATKLSRHFAGDDPPPAMVARVEKAFLASGGDLPTVYRAIAASPEAWDASRMKFRNPWDWSIAAFRALGFPQVPGQASVRLLKELGQPVWQPPAPTGWDDDTASWAGPDALVRRVEAAQRLASQRGDGVDARALAPTVLGAALTDRTKTAIARAESPATGLALLLASPEVLRR